MCILALDDDGEFSATGSRPNDVEKRVFRFELDEQRSGVDRVVRRREVQRIPIHAKACHPKVHFVFLFGSHAGLDDGRMVPFRCQHQRCVPADLRQAKGSVHEKAGVCCVCLLDVQSVENPFVGF